MNVIMAKKANGQTLRKVQEPQADATLGVMNLGRGLFTADLAHRVRQEKARAQFAVEAQLPRPFRARPF